MPDKATFRRAVLQQRPELAGRLWLNKIHSPGFYTVTVRKVITFYWVDVAEDVETAVRCFFAELDDLNAHSKLEST